MRTVFTFSFLLTHCLSFSQAVSSLPLPDHLGLTVNHKRFSDPFSFQLNPASLAGADRPLAAVCSERKFMLPDMNYFYGAFALPVQSGGVGLAAGYCGLDGFSQARLTLAYAKKLGGKMALGAGFNYNRITASGYGSTSTVTFGVGVQFFINDRVTIGLASANPVGGRLGKSTEKMASHYSGGVGSRLSEKVFCAASLEKEEDSAARLIFKLQYDIASLFRIQAGASVTSGEAFIGSAIILKSIEIRQVVAWHQHLGVSPAITLFFHSKAEE